MCTNLTIERGPHIVGLLVDLPMPDLVGGIPTPLKNMSQMIQMNIPMTCPHGLRPGFCRALEFLREIQ